MVFEGKLLPGKNINTVKDDFSQLFKVLSKDKVNSFFSGHPVVLKKAITLDKAETYEHALLKIGAYCYHRPVEVEQSVGALDFEFTPVEEAPAEVETEAVDSVEDGVSAEIEEVAAIEFEYTAPEPEAPVAKEELAAEEGEQQAPLADSSPLSDLSLLPIEEQQSGEEEED